MRRPFVLVVLAILVAGLVLFGLGVAAVSDASIPDGEVASSISKADNSSASTAITMYATTGESWEHNT